MRYDHDRRSHDAHAVHTLMAYLSTPENPRAATLDDHAPADGGEG
jgi:hypothetical protein